MEANNYKRVRLSTVSRSRELDELDWRDPLNGGWEKNSLGVTLHLCDVEDRLPILIKALVKWNDIKLSINDLIVVSVVNAVSLDEAHPPEYFLGVVTEGHANHSPHSLLAGGLQGGLDQLARQPLSSVTAPGAEYEQVQQPVRLKEKKNILKFPGYFPLGRVPLLCQHIQPSE